MMEINNFASNGRELAVIFSCRRCKITAIRTLKECLSEVDYNFLTDLRPPKDWRDGGFYYPLFCPECAARYDSFMAMEDNDS